MEAKLSPLVTATQPTDAEIASAIESLFDNPAKLNKLRDYARFLVAGIGRAAEFREVDDLLSEAVTRTLEGKRIWNRGAVDIVGHLIGVMKSIASHWAESVSARRTTTNTESQIVRVNEEGDEINDFRQHPSDRPGPDRNIEAQQELDRLEQAFAGDREVTEILEALKAEITAGPEIQVLLGISPTEYETRMKRLRRKARSLNEARNIRHG